MFHIAIRHGNIETLEKFLPFYDINMRNCNGFTALHISAHDARLDMVEMLLGDENINPNIKNNYGDSPLHIAARRGYREIVDMLLAHKDIDPNIKNNDGKKPIDLFVYKK